MRALILLAFMILSGPLVLDAIPARAADPCEDPVAALCGSQAKPPIVTPDQIRLEVKAAQVKQEAISLTGDMDADRKVALPRFKRYIGSLYTVLLAHFKKQGVTEATIKAKIKAIQLQLTKGFLSGKMGPADKRLARRVSTAQMVGPGEISKLPSGPRTDEDLEKYYKWCGADGLLAQAFYNPTSHSFVMCPGYLLSVINSGSLDTLGRIVGHELTHSASSNGDFLKHLDRYGPYISCVEANFSGRMESVEHVMAELGAPAQARLSALEKEILAKPGDHSAELISVRDQMRIARDQVPDLKDIQDWTADAIGHQPGIAEMHASELVADAGGALSLVELAKKLPKRERAAALTAGMKGFCAAKASGAKRAKYGPLSDDGEHPPTQLRIENFFNMPEVRLALGCKQLAGIAPSCTIAGQAPVAVRCDAKSGGPSATECEKRITTELKGAGCKLGGLSCPASDGHAVECLVNSSNCQLGQSIKGSNQIVCADKSRLADFKATKPPVPGICVDKPVPIPANQLASPKSTAGPAQPH
jgi:hypothetical protein